MNSPKKTFFVLLGLDLVFLLLTFNLVRFSWGIGGGAHWIIAPLALPFATLVFAIYLIDGYRARTDMMSLDYTSLHAIALLSAELGTLLMTYVVKLPGVADLQYSRGVIAFSYLALVPLTLSYRGGELDLPAWRSTPRAAATSCFSATGPVAAHCSAPNAKKSAPRKRIVYSVVSDESATPFTGDKVDRLRPFSEVIDDIQHDRIPVEALVLRESNRELEPEIAQKLVQLYFRGLPTYTLELFHQIYWRKIPTYRLNQTWLFQEGFQIAREPVFERLKRVGDVILAGIGLILAAPLILLGALAVWLEDRGPVLFRADPRRERTMCRSASTSSAPCVADAARGRPLHPARRRAASRRSVALLRASRLDELPQIWNVLPRRRA